MMLDEPVAGMSVHEREKTAELLPILGKGRAVVVVEHDMDFVARIAHRVTVLHQGKLLAEGSMDTLQKDPMDEQGSNSVLRAVGVHNSSGYDSRVLSPHRRRRTLAHSGGDDMAPLAGRLSDAEHADTQPAWGRRCPTLGCNRRRPATAADGGGVRGPATL
jgi:ABC-type multidrug transport system ATPase subunit